MARWKRKPAISFVVEGEFELAVVKWKTCWCWQIEMARLDETKPMLAKGLSPTRKQGELDCLKAFEQLPALSEDEEDLYLGEDIDGPL